ncbi:MAG: hypothetical protein ACOY3Z_07265 [Thermodesulfobacteriota bacterium]
MQRTLKKTKRLLKKVGYLLRSPNDRLHFRPDGRTRIEALAHWPLFDRMRVAAASDLERSTKRQLFGSANVPDPPIRHIAPEDFSAARLFAEIKALAASGGEIHLPAGRIELDRELALPAGLRLVGVPGRTELVFKDVPYGIIIRGTADPIRWVRLEHLRLRHEGDHRFCAAVFVSTASDILFSHVEILAPRAVGFLLADGVRAARLEHCTVSRAALVGFMLVRDVQDTVLHACVAEYCGQGGAFLTDLRLPSGMDPMDFDGQLHHTNEIIGNFGPFAPEDPSPYRTTFANCVFRHNRKMGITTDGVGYLRVMNCVIAENDCEGITIDNGSWCCHIQGCHIYNNGWRGLQHEVELHVDFVEGEGALPDGSSKAKLPGVSLDNAAYIRVEDNCIEGNWGDGVKFVRAVYGCTVARNLIANNNRGGNDRFHFFGVLAGIAERQHPEQYDFPSCHNRIVENDILGPHYAGIHLMHVTTGNLILNNRIVGASFAPVEDHDTRGNVIRGNEASLNAHESGHAVAGHGCRD